MPARGQARRGGCPARTRTTVLLHHAPGDQQRTLEHKPQRAGDTQTQNAVKRQRHPHPHGAAGIHAAAGAQCEAALAGGARARIKGVYYSMTTGGTISIAEGNGGQVRLTFTVPIGTNYFLIPGEGVLFEADPYITFTTAVGSLTVFYG